MLQLNIVTMTERAQIFGLAMAERDQGRILLVSSISGYQATPAMPRTAPPRPTCCWAKH